MDFKVVDALPHENGKHLLCLVCNTQGTPPYLDIGYGMYGSDLWKKPETGERLLCSTCIADICRAVGVVQITSWEAEAKKSADYAARLVLADEHAAEAWTELSPLKARAADLEIELESATRALAQAEARLTEYQNGEAERREHREKMAETIATLGSGNGPEAPKVSRSKPNSTAVKEKRD